MTLKNHKNHYNVKFLSGYGLSISLKNNKIQLKNGTYPYSEKQDSEEWFITNIPYEKIVISGKGYISTEAISLLNENNRNVVITDTYGKPVSLMNGCMDSLTATKYRMAQYDAFRNPEKCLYLTREFLKSKLESQIRFLEWLDREDSKQTISKLQGFVNEIDYIEEPNRIEAKAGNVFFRYYSTLFDPKHCFTSRNQSFIRSSKNKATDPINALLNYGYAVLAGEISKFVCGFGLDPYYGFNHRSHTGFQPLVYDIMESFRWLVEKSVYYIVNKANKAYRLRLKDYAWTKQGTVVLSDRIKRNFLERLEREFQRERKHEFKHGKKTKSGLKSVQEITIAKIKIQKLLKFVDKD